MSRVWKQCSSCKKDILGGQKYYECSVSTCTGKRTGYVFCSVPCWELHLPGARHKNAFAVEEKAPMVSSHFSPSPSAPTKFPAPAVASQMPSSPVRRIIAQSSSSSGAVSSQKSNQPLSSASQHDILIVASKLKNYVKERGGDMNTSASVMTKLSQIVRKLCDDAILNARSEGRKTLMDRDF